MKAAWLCFERAVERISTINGYLSGVLIAVSATIVTYEVVWRYFFSHPHAWSLELNIFLLIAATFLAASYTQFKRGHIGTEVLDLVLSKRLILWRIFLGDCLSFVFCIFIGIQVSLYAMKAWREGWVTDSVWAPSLWVPYSLIAIGMILISLQYLVQIVNEVAALIAVDQKGELK